jgi:hypothetical protein
MGSVLPGLKLAEAPTPGTKVLANKLLSRWNDRGIEDLFQSVAHRLRIYSSPAHSMRRLPFLEVSNTDQLLSSD